jgi:AraC-like DNA-binding protein
MLREPHLLQLAELFDYIEDVKAWVKDRDGRFIWVNRANLLSISARRREGHAGEDCGEVLGKTDRDLCPAFLADQYCTDDEHVLAGNRIVNRIELVPQSDGTFAWHVTNKIPVLASDGTIIGTAGISRRGDVDSQGALPGVEFGSVLAYLRDHYGAPIGNGQLARLAHMSVRAFERKFQNCFHLTPQAYLRKLRMRMASHALVYGNQPLSRVASSCGFADQSHFTREFRRHFGQTPRQYRQHYSREAAHAVSGTESAAAEQDGSEDRC